ncbi:hypothetical protein NHQ30_000827 [Ciborinia camelliae]|nr:hypothetical protein NHQ30_000827 [Ciborinia camelliae]
MGIGTLMGKTDTVVRDYMAGTTMLSILIEKNENPYETLREQDFLIAQADHNPRPSSRLNTLGRNHIDRFSDYMTCQDIRNAKLNINQFMKSTMDVIQKLLGSHGLKDKQIGVYLAKHKIDSPIPSPGTLRQQKGDAKVACTNFVSGIRSAQIGDTILLISTGVEGIIQNFSGNRRKWMGNHGGAWYITQHHAISEVLFGPVVKRWLIRMTAARQFQERNPEVEMATLFFSLSEHSCLRTEVQLRVAIRSG